MFIITRRLLHGCCKACYRACCKIVARVLQECCKIVVRVLQECLIQGLLQDCPPVHPRPRFKIITARLLHGCCKACYRGCCKIVARVLQECLIQGLLQVLLQDCCRSAARVLDSRLAASLLQDCPPARAFASR